MPLIVSEQSPQNFGALTLCRATFELRVGTMSPLERALQITPDVVLQARPELEAYLRAKTGLRVNEDLEGEAFPGLPNEHPWQILAHSNALIAADYQAWRESHVNYREQSLMSGAHIIGSPSDVHLGAGAMVLPGCVLDATSGPIIVDEGARISWSQLTGPVFIGRNCILDGARLRPGTSLGAHCKVGGEVSASIFQERVNKAHDGFVGNSWAGRWVNFGALATTSNLKNTYGSIRWQRDGTTTVDTGAQFLGSIVGEHTKIGIMQGLTTGAHIGVGCNVFGGGISPKWVPSFSWGGASGWQEHRLEAFLKTTRTTLSRRKVGLRPESEAVLRQVFAQTSDERAHFLTPKP